MTNSASSRSLNAAYELDALAVRAFGPQILAEAPGVVRDQRVRRLQDVARGAVVLLEAEQLRGRIVARKRVRFSTRAPRQR